MQAFDWPEELFATRVWRVPRPRPEPELAAEAVSAIKASKRPLLVAGGGVRYSEATAELASFAWQTGIPVAETQAGKGSIEFEHPSAVGAIGATGTTAANRLAAEADLVIGAGTRWSDFTTASSSVFAAADVRFINLNISAFDAAKQSAIPLVADVRAGLDTLAAGLGDWQVAESYQARARDLAAAWNAEVDKAYHLGHQPLPAQSEVIGAVNEACQPGDVVVCAAGSMPGDLHKLWRPAGSDGYHVEYGYSCMGYEIPGGMGVKLARPEAEVYVMIGDGSYLMLSSELVTAVQEGIKLIVVLVQNHGYQSIGALSDTVGTDRFGTWYRYRNPATGQLDGDVLPVDLAANAASLGARVLRADTIASLREALATARASEVTTVIHVHTDPLVAAPDSAGWWDVPVAEVADRDSTVAARAGYERARRPQHPVRRSSRSR